MWIFLRPRVLRALKVPDRVNIASSVNKMRFVRVESWLHQRYGCNLFSLKILHADTWLIPWFLAISRIFMLGLFTIWWSFFYHDRSLNPRFSIVTVLFDETAVINALSHAGTFSRSVFSVLENTLCVYFFRLVSAHVRFSVYLNHMNEYRFIFFDKLILDSLHRVELLHDKYWSIVDKVHRVYYFRFVCCSRIFRNIRVWVE